MKFYNKFKLYKCETRELKISRVIIVIFISLAVFVQLINLETIYFSLLFLAALAILVKSNLFYSVESAELRIDPSKNTLLLSNYSDDFKIDEVISIICCHDKKSIKIYFKHFFLNMSLSDKAEINEITNYIRQHSNYDVSLNQRLITIFDTRKPIFTYSLLTIISAVFIVQILYDPSFSEISLINFGGNHRNSVFDGEFYRIMISNFLHNGFLHFFNNVLAIYFLGRCLEKMVGIRIMLALTLLSAVLGATISVIFRDANITTSVGSSTIIMGYIGALFYLNILNPKWFTKHFSIDYSILVVIVLLPSFYPYIFNLDSTVDHFSHLGGGFASFLLFLNLKGNSIFYKKTCN